MFGQDYMTPMNPMQRYMNPMTPINPMMPNPIQTMPPINMPQSPFVAKQVGNIEEAKAHITDGLSTYLFVDYNAGKIYLKRLGSNGLSEFYTFTAEQNSNNQRKDPLVEINERLEKIENYLGGKSNVPESNAGNATASNEPNATVQPTTIFQGNGNA